MRGESPYFIYLSFLSLPTHRSPSSSLTDKGFLNFSGVTNQRKSKEEFSEIMMNVVEAHLEALCFSVKASLVQK